jgi:holo-[acyl-carrier protein] synthase
VPPQAERGAPPRAATWPPPPGRPWNSSPIRTGVDLVGVDRLRRLLDEQPELAERVFTTRELAYCRGRRRSAQHLAARFAAKEAVLKAVGTGLGRRMLWTDVEVVNERGGRPAVRLHGEVARWAEHRRITAVDVSLSHTAGMAMAHAIAVHEVDQR